MFSYIKLVLTYTKYKILYLSLFYLPDKFFFITNHIKLLEYADESDTDFTDSDKESENELKNNNNLYRTVSETAVINNIIKKNNIKKYKYDHFKIIYANLISYSNLCDTNLTNKLPLLMYLNANTLSLRNMKPFINPSHYKLIIIYHDINKGICFKSIYLHSKRHHNGKKLFLGSIF